MNQRELHRFQQEAAQRTLQIGTLSWTDATSYRIMPSPHHSTIRSVNGHRRIGAEIAAPNRENVAARC